MDLKSLCSQKKYLKIDYLNITRKHQLIGINWRNKHYFCQCWVIQPSFSPTWDKSKSLTPDVETKVTNDYMNKLIKFLNNNHNFSQNFNCDFSYLNRLSKLKLQNFACGSLTKSKQDFFPNLTVFQQSRYQRYKINFGTTEEVLQHFRRYIVEILLTGSRLSRKECYKVATW
jgi:hypothetical protein